MAPGIASNIRDVSSRVIDIRREQQFQKVQIIAVWGAVGGPARTLSSDPRRANSVRS